jgi:hypothetical protein
VDQKQFFRIAGKFECCRDLKGRATTAKYSCPFLSIRVRVTPQFMAWRIHDSVQRGEIDNRKKGIVRGRIWLHGLAGPVALELQGNACPDLAGCLLTFENPGETIPLRTNAGMNLLQRGMIGDLTASRKVRVFDIPVAEAYERMKKKLPVPEHMANSLYLEWFSQANGRVVVESADYKLAISAPVWTLTPEEEQQRKRSAAEGFNGFIGKLSAALEVAKHEPSEDKDWDEFDYEKFLRESDARTDKYAELLDKYMNHPDRDRLIAKEMGWEWMEEALDDEECGGTSSREQSGAGSKEGGAPDAVQDLDEDDDDDNDSFDADEINRITAEAVENPPEPDPTTEGVDWVRDEDGDIKHPLSRRAFNSSMDLWQKCDKLGLGKMDDDDLCVLVSEFQITGAKLAGALDSLAYGRDHREGAFTVAYLKRALGHVHAAQAALEKVSPKDLLPAGTITATRAELFAIREDILRLMEEFRRSK